MPQSRSSDSWDAALYAETARYVTDHGNVIFGWLSPQPGERILDLGCGDGVLTEKIGEAGAAVVGVDSNREMVGAARERGLDARVVRAEELEFDEEFDGVFSNAALHWVLRADEAVTGVRRALRPGGRFVAEFGGSGNVAAIVNALTQVLKRRGVAFADVSPWYFPTPEEYSALLETNGFHVTRAELVPRPTPLPGDVSDWLCNFVVSVLGHLAEEDRKVALADTRGLLKPHLRDDKGAWSVDYVRLRVEATRQD